MTANSPHPLLWVSSYHHVLCHNLAFGAVVLVLAWIAGARRWLAAFLVFLSFHLHLAADLIGSRGPDGYQWPIRYLYPLASWQMSWNGQWELNAWPNYIITLLALLIVLGLAIRRGYSPVEMVSASADRAVVHAIRQRWRSSCQL